MAQQPGGGLPSGADELERPRTISRHRYVAPDLAPPGGRDKSLDARKRIGRYEIIKLLGKGAMGQVFQGRDPLLDRIVAIKTIVAPQNAVRRGKTSYLERFQREARAAAKMQHPSIVTIFDIGVDEDAETPFMVLEYLPGESLADRLDRVRIPLARCVQIGLDLASALAFAHKERIVHRDVKPANVLHAGENRWKLADFGIARLPDSDLTQVGIFMGTPGYAPPEAIREGRYTAQADVFAWGAVLYELFCGRIAYEGPDTKTTNGYVLKGDAPPPTRHDPSIPMPLVEVVMKSLAPNASERFRDAVEMEQALREAWDLCLRRGLVPATALTAEEVTHDKVRGPFHLAPAAPCGGANASPQASPPARPPAKPPAPAPMAATAPRREPPPEDDDDQATRIMYRPDAAAPAARPVPMAAPLVASQGQSRSGALASLDRLPPVAPVLGGRHDDPTSVDKLPPRAMKAPRRGFPWFWLLLFVLLAALGAAVTVLVKLGL
ncbi:MAG: serine/threonine protein kinase [Myxococcales bacterium]|nr:serine/threonine protein kinase [Myxococcales bacterium]